MKRLLSLWQALGFAVTGVLGVLLHFVFEWTNGSVFVAPFSAVNESIWEHTKLIFFPMFVFAIIEYMNIGGKYKNFWCVKLIGTLLGIISILVLYYTINGIFGKTPDFVNIVIFFVSAFISYYTETKLFNQRNLNCISARTALIILIFITILYAMFTFMPPHIPLFKDPQNNTFGYFKQ